MNLSLLGFVIAMIGYSLLILTGNWAFWALGFAGNIIQFIGLTNKS